MDANRTHIGVSGGQQSYSQQLGVNKNSKSIKKSPTAPQVYNIDKSDFRKLVQHLTGPSNPNLNQQLHQPSPDLPLHRSPSLRLQRIRPPPLFSFPRQCPNPALELQQKAEESHMSFNPPVSTGTAATARRSPSLSPTFKFPSPLSPNLMLSPLSLSGGISGSFLQSLASPGGSLFPSSPSSVFLGPIWGKADN